MQRRHCGRRDLLDAARRPGNAGIVDQRIEAAQCLAGAVKQRATSSSEATSALIGIGLGMRLAEVVQDIRPRHRRSRPARHWR